MTLYLLNLERDAYDELPAKLREAWNGMVQEEAGTAWETDEQLQVRLDIASKQISPKAAVALGKMMEKAKTEGIDGISEKDFPKSTVPQILFLLGAVGLTTVIFSAMSDATSVDDLEAAASLSTIRHQMLMANALAFA